MGEGADDRRVVSHVTEGLGAAVDVALASSHTPMAR